MSRKKKPTYDKLIEAVAHAQRNVITLMHEWKKIHPNSNESWAVERLMGQIAEYICSAVKQPRDRSQTIVSLQRYAENVYHEALRYADRYRERMAELHKEE